MTFISGSWRKKKNSAETHGMKVLEEKLTKTIRFNGPKEIYQVHPRLLVLPLELEACKLLIPFNLFVTKVTDSS